ncbi:stage III sporulation protein AE [Anaerobacterium chartisolvens]|uniref:Stage III sporulation protein AE n=1 Tax=Anaerobacterium chartisolvens TaxID=1297424 RepID=A0A369B5M9_9FIRM|nr:stage III sporulation protein AE [Anaerobacterium chartisolvens]RCX16793.1 stage III sporulation protein AE [Anaerobacterium chartisolvens]
MNAGYKRYIKPAVFIAALLWLQLAAPLAGHAVNGYAGAEAGINESIINEQANSDHMLNMQAQIDKYSGEGLNELLPGYSTDKLMDKAASGNLGLDLKDITERVAKYLFREFYENTDVLIKLIVLVILCAVLKNLQASFLSESVGELAFYVCYIVLVSVMLTSLNTAIELGKGIIDDMVSFMHSSIPVLISLLVSGGNITSAGVFQPILVMIVQVTATIIKNVFIPLVFLSVIVSIVDNVSDKIQISRLAQFLKQVSGWGLGLILTIFIGIISIQGSLGAVVDGVASKTVKFTISAAIPVAGKYLADAADTVIGCTLLVKNAAGIAAMIGVIGICILPILKIFVLLLLYRITCILIEPIAEKRVVNCLNEMAGSLTFILGLTAAVAFMFLFSITVIITASNISTMIR